MLLYTPNDLPSGAPVVVVLHGCTQGAEAHAEAAGWLALADRHGFAVLAPEQTPANNPNRCFNWFEPGDIRRSAGEAASIQAMVARSLQQHALDAGRVYVTGLSAGGAMAAVMLAAYPDVFAGGAVIAGLPYGVARNVADALGAMHGPKVISDAQLAGLVRDAAPGLARCPRIAIWHGDGDRTVNVRNGSDLARQWTAAHGLAAEPSSVERLPRHVRSTWRSNEGEALVELNIVAGLGHGTPLAATGPNAVGAPAPYMLEAGVSSSLEALGFWGLTSSTEAGEPTVEAATFAAPPPPPNPTSKLGQTVMSAIAGHVPSDVQGVISRALRSAGLM